MFEDPLFAVNKLSKPNAVLNAAELAEFNTLVPTPVLDATAPLPLPTLIGSVANPLIERSAFSMLTVPLSKIVSEDVVPTVRSFERTVS